MEAMNPSFHLGRRRPLLKLQLSRVHHGSEEEGQPVTCQPVQGKEALTRSPEAAGTRQALVPPAGARRIVAVLPRARQSKVPPHFRPSQQNVPWETTLLQLWSWQM